MSSLAEIEAAITRLPAPQFDELSRWMERRRAESTAPTEAKKSVTSFFGITSSGRPNGADNAAIDRDIAAEAGRDLP